ncbi:sulfur carrier protein ThiS adenylyltransferase ThiF [Salinivirga cyanobacteriivorans]|uniref:Molybdopterin-synthase adenylyltransferase n=1 Tax=Salinivirga cyanobacteriivorans TaxID=1307839 RepID=A0A0S2HVX9_9BACT|nr:sulfur carrier protein ThiS adenylyltransferase ThiF [Salinivirga cyanobacteriivorans]ALO14170.1 Molybdopterin-synthase adenylyltransferase [Salinivirga cyanobacteriivorans]
MRTYDQIHKILENSKIGIAGAGGLGSNVATSLARCGIGKLVIADYDSVSEDCLNRQYFFYDQIGIKKVSALEHVLERINPHTKVEAHDIKLTEEKVIELFTDCDVIVEAIGDARIKQQLIESVLVKLPEKHLVIASGLAGYGNNNRFTTEQYDKLWVCGDQEAEVNELNPPMAPAVGIVANMQANVVIDILLRKL